MERGILEAFQPRRIHSYETFLGGYLDIKLSAARRIELSPSYDGALSEARLSHIEEKLKVRVRILH
jgi:hypothetical protein